MANKTKKREENPAHYNIGGEKGGDISGLPTESPGGAKPPSESSGSGKSTKGAPRKKTAGKVGGDISGEGRKSEKRK